MPETPVPLPAGELKALVGDWYDLDQVADYLDLTPAAVKTLIKRHDLAAATVDGVVMVPADFFDEGWIVKGVPGLLTVLHDADFGDEEILAWLFDDIPELPGRPIDALRENRGSEVKRRAQAMDV